MTEKYDADGQEYGICKEQVMLVHELSKMTSTVEFETSMLLTSFENHTYLSGMKSNMCLESTTENCYSSLESMLNKGAKISQQLTLGKEALAQYLKKIEDNEANEMICHGFENLSIAMNKDDAAIVQTSRTDENHETWSGHFQEKQLTINSVLVNLEEFKNCMEKMDTKIKASKVKVENIKLKEAALLKAATQMKIKQLQDHVKIVKSKFVTNETLLNVIQLENAVKTKKILFHEAKVKRKTNLLLQLISDNLCMIHCQLKYTMDILFNLSLYEKERTVMELANKEKSKIPPKKNEDQDCVKRIFQIFKIYDGMMKRMEEKVQESTYAKSENKKRRIDSNAEMSLVMETRKKRLKTISEKSGEGSSN